MSDCYGSWANIQQLSTTTVHKNVSGFEVSILASGDDHGIAWLERDILARIPAPDYVFVVEGKPGLRAILILAEYVNRLLLCKVPETAGQRDGIQNRSGSTQ